MDPKANLTRRKFFASSGVAALSVGTAGVATTAAAEGTGAPYVAGNSDMAFEIIRTDAEWREMLTEFEYTILREGDTETPNTSDLRNEVREGTYACRGCDLVVYASDQKVQLNKGWVFFFNSEPDTVLMSIDRDIPPEYSAAIGRDSVVELHCRRCASHLGHFLILDEVMTHCINGAALKFEPTAA